MNSFEQLPEPLSLRPLGGELAHYLAHGLAAIEPWSRFNIPPASMASFFLQDDPALTRRAVFVQEEPAGFIAVRGRWLGGPYLQMLGLLPAFQGQGHGAHLLHWFEGQAQPHHRWLWLCHSSFNEGAGRFYRRHGFEPVATLPDLVADGFDEVLMRKRIAR